MNCRLVDLLRRNYDNILDDWQTELELLPPNEDFTHGDLSYEYLTGLFENVLNLLSMKSDFRGNPPDLHNYMDFTFTCAPESAACIELHKAAHTAFFRVLEKNNTRKNDFSPSEGRVFARLLQNALAITLRREIETCSNECNKYFCPFLKSHENQFQFLGQVAGLSNSR